MTTGPLRRLRMHSVHGALTPFEKVSGQAATKTRTSLLSTMTPAGPLPLVTLVLISGFVFSGVVGGPCSSLPTPRVVWWEEDQPTESRT